MTDLHNSRCDDGNVFMQCMAVKVSIIKPSIKDAAIAIINPVG